jgi:hypothetical protein
LAANNIGLTYTELRRHIGREIGKDRDPSAWSSATTADAGDILKGGLRQFYWPQVLPGESTPHVWSFLQPTLAQLELHGAYETGTVSVTTGTVTLSGGTWPTWAAQGDLWVNDGYYPVNTRTNGTTIVLHDTSVTGLSGETYSLKHREYDLPDDFGGMVESFTYRVDQTRGRTLTRVNESMIRTIDSYPEHTGTPEYFAITSVAPTSAQESKSRAVFNPSPDGTYTLWYRYSVVPPMLDGSSYVYAHGGAEYSETLKLSCLDVALSTLYRDDSAHARFMESLTAAVQRDRRVNRPTTHGRGVFSDGYDLTDVDWRRRNVGDFTFDVSNL